MSRQFEFVLLDAEAALASEDTRRTSTCGPCVRTNASCSSRCYGRLVARWAGAARLDSAIGEAVPRAPERGAGAHGRAVAKVRAAVHDRLRREIDYWDQRASELREQASAGKQPRMNPTAPRRAQMSWRPGSYGRMAELDREERLQALPPVLVGGALVGPAGLLARLRGDPEAPPEVYTLPTAEVERRAVDAVRRSRVASVATRSRCRSAIRVRQPIHRHGRTLVVHRSEGS